MTSIIFREIPQLIEIEQDLQKEPGLAWRPEFEKRVDQVAIQLFGISRTRCHLPEPQPDDFTRTNSDLSAFNEADDNWRQWENEFRIPAGWPSDFDQADLLESLGIDVWDENDDELRCAEWFERPAIAAAKEIGGAAFTPDGSGQVGSASAEDWGAAIAAEAARFRGSR